MHKEKPIWMRNTRIRLFMQIELLAWREEPDWLMRYHQCAVNNYPGKNRPPTPLPAPPVGLAVKLHHA